MRNRAAVRLRFRMFPSALPPSAFRSPPFPLLVHGGTKSPLEIGPGVLLRSISRAGIRRA